MDAITRVTLPALNFLTTLFVFAIGFSFLLVIILYFVDRGQTRNAVRHNYPVIGRFRYLFSSLGEFFRQYFFAMDREEMPFNRAEREWIDKSAKGHNNNQPFGSTRNLALTGTPIFVNCAFPRLDEEASDPPPVIYGPHTPNPYEASSIINISGMSYGCLLYTSPSPRDRG